MARGANLRIDATFPDSVYLSAEVRADGDTTVESNDPGVVVERLTTVEDLIASSPSTEASKILCALSVASAAITCGGATGPVGVLGCGIAAGLVACECIPFFDAKIPDDAECV
jgi:hypothetical protein